MLRVLEFAVIVAIVIYGIVRLIEMFNTKQVEKKEKILKSRQLSDLEKKAKKVAAEKETILNEVSKNKETIDNISNTLNN